MLVYRKLEDLYNIKQYSMTLALGTFDGIHIGHQIVIKRAVSKAKELGILSCVFTFRNHPKTVTNPDNNILCLNNRENILSNFEELEVDVLVEIPFSKDLALKTPYDFLEYLTRYCSIKCLVVGDNYTFGHKGIGTPKTLIEFSEYWQFSVVIVPILMRKNHKISSSYIRELILKGEIEQASSCLGRYFTFGNIVIDGDKRGRLLGFPTANLEIGKNQITPPNGVYVVSVTYNKKMYYGLANIGYNPTFDGMDRRLEVFIFNFNENIYGERIDVHFLHFIRNEQKFNDILELQEQIKSDLLIANKWLLNLK